MSMNGAGRKGRVLGEKGEDAGEMIPQTRAPLEVSIKYCYSGSDRLVLSV